MKIELKPILELVRFYDPLEISLLLWPTLWALWIAAQGFPSWRVLIVFILGGILAYSAITIFNDIADRKYDGNEKPINHKELITDIISIKFAWLLCVLLFFCVFGLALLLNWLTVFMAGVGLLLIIIYPFSKRLTHWSGLFLGMATASGVPIAFAAQTGEVPILCWLLTLIAVIWPMIYDTTCSIVDKEDDIKSTAILFSENLRLFLTILQLLMIFLLIILGIFGGLGIPYYLGLLMTCGLFYYQYKLIETHLPENCLKSYKNNNWIGGILFIGIVVSFIF